MKLIRGPINEGTPTLYAFSLSHMYPHFTHLPTHSLTPICHFLTFICVHHPLSHIHISCAICVILFTPLVLHVGVVIGFEQIMYTATEGSDASVELCAVLTMGTLKTEAIVTFFTSDGSAMSRGSDLLKFANLAANCLYLSNIIPMLSYSKL